MARSERRDADDEPRIPIVGIGASAGGLDALQRLFRDLPDDLGAAYVVIVHLAPDRDSELPAILARETRMTVVQVGDHDQAELEPNRVYVIAPDRKLELTDSSVGASRFEQPRGRRAAVDLFFRSLCSAHSDVYAIILSGGGSDGAVGARAVKEAGGLVLVQDPHEAAHDSMPRAAIATGVVDLVLPMRDLAARLAHLLRNRHEVARVLERAQDPSAAEQDQEVALKRVMELLRRRTGHDFSNYKRNTVLRRLVRRMQLNRMSSTPQYLEFLEENVAEVQALFNDLLITVTTFFRDPEAWAALREHVVAPLVERTDSAESIRCWVPGCATGEEAYSLAMLFAEEMERARTQQQLTIFASDVDERALAIGREGVYPGSIHADVSDERLMRWFRATDDHYRVAMELRDRVVFTAHSLQRDPPFSRLHLISCRNLLIYMDRDLQDQVMQIFRYACRDDGYLFLGSSETVNAELFAPVAKQYRIYHARPSPNGRTPMLPGLSRSLPQPRQLRETAASRRDREGDIGAHRSLLEEQAPPSVVVDENWSVRTFSETAGRYFLHQGGSATHSAPETVRSELRGELIVALRHAFEAHESYLSDFVAVRFNGTPRRVAVLVQPRPDGENRPTQALVLFLEAGTTAGTATAPAESEPRSDLERVLGEKLFQAEQHIEHLRADHHAAEEDLRAANEELQSLNEEYRSTTEELETSKEELQSINEELQTMNVELKTKLEEVSRAHDDLENLMAATDIATLFVDRKLCIKRFTPPLAEIFNVKVSDRNRPISDFTHSLDYQRLPAEAQRILDHLTPFEREVHSTDGRHFILRMRPYRTAEDRIDGVVITLLDVSQLKSAEAVLRESEARFRALVDASAQMVWTTDPTGSVVEDSPSWQAFTGQTRDQRKGWGWLDAIHPEDRVAAEQAWAQALERLTPLDIELRVHHAESGSYRWTSLRAVPLRADDGTVRGWVGMNIDITDLMNAVEALRQADARKDEFMGMLAHELRNPLAAIRNSVMAAQAQFGASEDGGDMVRKVLAIVDRQSHHMARLVDGLLDVTRITRDKLTLHRQPTDLCRAVQEVAQALRPVAERAAVNLTLDLPDALLMLDADPERLAQIVGNVLQNAVKFTKAGGAVTVNVRPDGDNALLVISDTGIGIDPAQIDGLFEPYRQASKDGDGLGLGLTLVKRLVEMHGGTIHAHSDGIGQGSDFSITLPLAPSPQPANAPAAILQPVPRRVLVVDDEADVADAFANLLKGLNQDVILAYSGQQALEIALQQRPQVVFVDLAMPRMNGVELAERLRRQFAANELTLVALGGHLDASSELFQHRMVKPAEEGDVRDLLNALAT